MPLASPRRPAARLLVRLTLLATLLTPAGAAAQIGGPINTLTFGSFALGSTDVEGRLAVGGDFMANGFGVGNKLPTAGGNTVVVGGSATISNGQINQGNLVVGGALAMSSVGIPQGTATSGVSPLPVDFLSLQQSQRALADAIKAQTPNGTSNRQPWGAIELTGSNAGINYFSFDGSWFNNASGFSITTPGGSTAIVTITGTSIPMIRNFQMFLNNVSKDRVLLNFADATVLTTENFSFVGSVLAPRAAVAGMNGHVDGDFVATSFRQNGSFEFHYVPFAGALPPATVIPEPSTVALLAGGLGLLGLGARRRRR